MLKLFLLPVLGAATPAAAQPIGPSPYLATPLDFEPHAINDSRLIVGVRAGVPVRYSQGTTSALPFLPFPGAKHVAIDVNNAGVILGDTGLTELPAVYWKPPSFKIDGGLEPYRFGVFAPAVLNDSLVIVGNAGDANAALRWTRTGGYQNLLHTRQDQGATVTDINDGGTAVGRIFGDGRHLLIWPPGATLAQVVRTDLRGSPLIRNDGVIVWVASPEWIALRTPSGQITERRFSGVGEIILTGVSNSGRLIGIVNKYGAVRAWTLLGAGPMVWLTAPGLQTGDHLLPTGVNSCGDIVSEYRRASQVGGGVLHAKALTCDRPFVPGPGSSPSLSPASSSKETLRRSTAK